MAIILVEIILLVISISVKYFEHIMDPMLNTILIEYAGRIIIMVTIIIVFVVVFIERALSPIITRPLKRIVAANILVSQGEIDAGRRVELEPGVPEEIFSMVESREKMLSELERLNKETALQKEQMREELSFAGEMQKQLLPASPPEIEGARIGVLYEAFSFAGGDIYDFMELDGRLGILIGDVSGHGVASSLAASMVKIPFEMMARKGMPLNKVLEEMNTTLHPVLGETGLYITSFYGLFDFQRKEFTYTMAGHPPQLLVREGEAIRIQTDGAYPLGMFNDASYALKTTSLKSADRFYFFTDGAYEVANNEEEQFGYEQFAKLCQQCHKLPVEDVPKAIFDKLETYSSGRRQDDICLIVVEIA